MARPARPAVDPSEFLEKRILVTGGTKGAGKAIADRFLRGGGTVIVTARSEPAETTGRHFIQADVSTVEGTTTVIRETLERFKGVDVIVHNVGARPRLVGVSRPPRMSSGSKPSTRTWTPPSGSIGGSSPP